MRQSVSPMAGEEPVKLSSVSLELEPIVQPATALAEFSGDNSARPHDMIVSARRRADMTSVHSPVDLMTFEEPTKTSDKAECLLIAGPRDSDHPGHAGASGVSDTGQKMNDEALAWKLWQEENETIKQGHQDAPGRYHAEDELLARALQEEYDQEGEPVYVMFSWLLVNSYELLRVSFRGFVLLGINEGVVVR